MPETWLRALEAGADDDTEDVASFLKSGDTGLKEAVHIPAVTGEGSPYPKWFNNNFMMPATMNGVITPATEDGPIMVEPSALAPTAPGLSCDNVPTSNLVRWTEPYAVDTGTDPPQHAGGGTGIIVLAYGFLVHRTAWVPSTRGERGVRIQLHSSCSHGGINRCFGPLVSQHVCQSRLKGHARCWAI
eukprot:4745771-Amphidinium_carterae.2